MRAIVFDLDGTLLDFECDYGEILHETFRTVEGTTSEAWVAAYHQRFYEHFDDFEPEPVQNTFASIDGSVDAEALASTLLEYEIEHSITPATVHDDLARLGSEFRLGVLTNGVPDWQRQKLDAHDLGQYFDAFVASYDAGAHKPDPRPFAEAEARLEADAYAMVGDSDADIDGARNAGWAAHRYRGDGFGDLPSALEWPSSER